MIRFLVILSVATLLGACGAPPKKPTTHTPAPALDSTRRFLVDSKDQVSRIHKRSSLIDNKLQILEDWK